MRIVILLLVLVINGFGAKGRDCHTNAKTISSKEEYAASVQAEPNKKIINLKELIANLVVEMPYATANNFTHTVLYHHPVALLRYDAAIALKKVQNELSKQHLALKIYDAYRPYSVTCKMWALVHDERYAADPAKGSDHNRAIAVDISLINTQTGKELPMGTGFDNFSDSAHYDFKYLSAGVIRNRKLLRNVMEQSGFKALETEWWHFAWYDKSYEIIDVDFLQLISL